MKRVHRVLLVAQYGLPLVAMALLARASRASGQPLYDIECSAVAASDDLAVWSLGLLWLAVVVLPGRAAALNVLAYCWFYVTVGLLQDQWLGGLASTVKSFPSPLAYALDVWSILLLLAATGLGVRVVARAIRSKYLSTRASH